MSQESPQTPLTPEQEQERNAAFMKLRVDTRQFTNQAITPQDFALMESWVNMYKSRFSIGNPPVRGGGQLSKQGQIKDPATGNNTHMWVLQYLENGSGIQLSKIPFPQAQAESQPVSAQAASVSTRVHTALNPSPSNASQLSMELQVQGETLKFFGASGRAQRLMVEDLLGQRNITLGKLLAYAKNSAEPDIAVKFFERYFEDIEAIGIDEIPADQWKLLEEFALRMNGTKTLVPDFCADKLARFHMKKSSGEILGELQTLYSRGSQPLMRITLLSVLGQKMKKGDSVSTEELKSLWRLGREEVFALLKYLPKEQRNIITE